MSAADFSPLDAVGLNLHAVLALDELPAALRETLDAERNYRQLILVGNGGPALWTAIAAAGCDTPDPIDSFSVRHVERWLAGQAGGRRRKIVYPGNAGNADNSPIALQALGELAGWHYASPLMVGINARWGTWFAYRAAVLAATRLAPTPRADLGPAPCLACASRPCAAACPGQAIADHGFDLQRCVAYRRRADSACRETCVARLACPAQAELRYPGEQLRHSYAISLRMIERHC